MLAVCMTLIDNDKDQTSFEDFYYRNRQIAYAFAYKILNNSALAEEACANAFFSIAKCFKKIHNYSLHDMDAYLIRTLRNAHDLTADEITQIMGISKRTVFNYLNKAKRQILDLIGGDRFE